jgi:UDP-N-acetylmuramate--alanine ligase
MYIPKVKNLHFVGVGGSGMSGIAEVLLNMGYHVSGSDLTESTVTERLRVLGGEIHIGHGADNVGDAQVVVTSSAIGPGNPEVLEAVRRKIPVIPRAEMLAELMRMKYSVAVAGAHGKTTTTSMVAGVLDAAGLDPTAVVGGKLAASGSNARLGQGEFLVAEADESDGSFLHLTPTWAVVTNIDREHLDFYGDIETIQEAFVDFANKVPFYGAVIVGVDSAPVREILPRLNKRVITCGISFPADVAAEGLEYDGSGSSFTVRHRGRTLGRLTVDTPGEHNVANALAAIAVGLELDIPVEKIFAALEAFRNSGRRFEFKGEAGGVAVFDDYGHHPVEIEATIRAARAGWNRRLVVVFQPHRYSRSRDLADDFPRAFDGADVVVLTDIYAAGEEPIPGVTGEDLFRRLEGEGGRLLHFVPRREDAAPRVLETLRRGDMVITLGAGDIWKTSEELVRLLEEREKDARD